MRIIRNNAKPRIHRILLHNPPQRHLRRTRHRIRLIQNNQLEPRHRARSRRRAHREDLLRARERLDLLAHDIDAAVVGGVQLENHLAHVGGAVDAAGEGEDS